MNTYRVHVKGRFHSGSAVFIPIRSDGDHHLISKRTLKRVNRALCGIKDCHCRDNLYVASPPWEDQVWVIA